MQAVEDHIRCSPHSEIRLLLGFPCIRVPVLSNTTVSLDDSFSRYGPPFINTPSLAALSIPSVKTSCSYTKLC
jgi:hypothetical protein